jgi:hypothetical protein
MPNPHSSDTVHMIKPRTLAKYVLLGTLCYLAAIWLFSRLFCYVLLP